jgi:hypothetical protein
MIYGVHSSKTEKPGETGEKPGTDGTFPWDLRDHSRGTPFTLAPGRCRLHDEPRASSTALGFFAITTRRVRAGPPGCQRPGGVARFS